MLVPRGMVVTQFERSDERFVLVFGQAEAAVARAVEFVDAFEVDGKLAFSQNSWVVVSDLRDGKNARNRL